MNTSYKYKIHYYLQKLSVEDYKHARKFLPKMLKCSNWTVQRWIYIKSGSKHEIPIDSLHKMADFFGITIEDLISEKIIKNQMQLEFELFKKSNLCSK